jgi:hypothetical protein
MNEPETSNVEISEFDYDTLYAGETLTLKLDLDFNSYDFSSEESHLAFIFKILDYKNFILGNAKQDNLIVFVNLNPIEIP